MTDYLKLLAKLSPEQRLLFERRLKERGLTLGQSFTIPKRPDPENTPLSFAQQRLWFIQQLEPTSSVYNVPCVLRLRGVLQVSALEKSLNELRRRHETLRTCFTTNAQKQPIQVITSWEPLALTIIDISEINTPLEVERLALAEAKRPFDLSQPLLRSLLLYLGEQEYILLLTTHHIISDRWSIGVFLKELSLLYSAFIQGETSSLPELPIQYADWAVWQRQQLQGEFLTEQISYWQQQLAGELPILQLSSRPQPAVPTYSGSDYPVALSPSLSQAIKALAAKQGVTLFMLLLTSFQVLLYRYTGEDDLVIGTDIVNRDRQETENLIGLLVNTVVLRTNLAGNPTVQELLARVREVTLAAFAHQYLPFEKLVEVLNPERNLSQMMPLFQVKFDLQLASVRSPQLPGLTLERLPFDEETAKYELRLNLQDTEQGITGQFEYSTNLFDVATIARMAEHWITLLESIVVNTEQKLSEISFLTGNEQQQFKIWNQTIQEYPSHQCLHQLFEAQVEQTPDEIALIFGEQSFTYRELNSKANQLAHHLQRLGVEVETPVGICLERSVEMVIGVLGILKAGGVYVPLDPAYPETRLGWILDDARVPILLTQTSSKPYPDSYQVNSNTKIVCLEDWKAIAENSVNNPVTNVTPENLAYLIYTSGSTGKPKGVMIEHRNPVCLLYWAREVFSTDAIAGVLASTSICFDLSIFELFVPLSWGGKVILAENALALPNLPAKNQVTLINTVPSAIAQLLQLNAIPNSVQTVNLAGEPLKWGLVQQLEQLPHIQQIFNLYGPSEDTTYSTYVQLKGITPVTLSPTIGQPIANSQVYVLDDRLQPVPVGVPGELYIGGAGVARGYWQRPDLTAERFVANPFTPPPAPPLAKGRGAREELWRGGVLSGFSLYKTGDRVRYLRDGNLEYLGRLDNQVKIRGYRIELGEIEAVLSQHPDVQECAVMAPEEVTGEKRLVAYIASLSAKSSDLRQFLAERLPGYMIPANFIPLEALPHTPNGKIDRQALPTVEKTRPELENAYVEARTPTEQTLAIIWEETLQVEQIGINDNFFALGGHSLLGIQLVAKINESLNVEVPLKSLFQHPTIAGLAAQIEQLQGDITQSGLPQIQPHPQERYQPFPLTDIQQAYLIGRNAAFELGNVATHGYQEIETVGLSVEQMEWALQRLIEHHDMLRVIVQPDGQQRVLKEVPPYKIAVTDLRREPLPNPPLAKGRELETLPNSSLAKGRELEPLPNPPLGKGRVPDRAGGVLSQPTTPRCQSLKRVICSGEALSLEMQNRFFQRLDAQLHNLYGPTEAAIDVTYYQCQPDDNLQTVPIGRPIANTQIYLLDNHLQLVPVGVPGELYIGGVGVARGYWKRPDLTAERFVPNPFDNSILYKSGDRARYLPDGNIEYLGRLDNQVKIRGLRIELGEIEALLNQHPAVQQAIATLHPDQTDNLRLVAYVVCLPHPNPPLVKGRGLEEPLPNPPQGIGRVRVSAGGVPTQLKDPITDELREFLAKLLPDYMLPSVFVILEELPLLPNGKVNRQALPAPEDIRDASQIILPRYPTEAIIANVWADVLRLEKVGVYDNFFELGGNSLSAIRATARLREAFQLDLPLGSLFEKPTIAGLAERIEILQKSVQQMQTTPTAALGRKEIEL
ncbi:non-ribosomal peptide synthetase [Nostoc commune]|uniref:non-ribosomal peptide synthetase n=1 Tax=Nostoc commune TaxID=1178 RepID=UPI001E3657DD|nr:non-ribosomal peptide synthetase [Nostoc commune]